MPKMNLFRRAQYVRLKREFHRADANGTIASHIFHNVASPKTENTFRFCCRGTFLEKLHLLLDESYQVDCLFALSFDTL